MFMAIALLCFLVAVLAVLRRRPPADPPVSRDPPPLPARHVSFSLVTSYSLPISPSPAPPVQRRWSSPFHKRKPSAPESPPVVLSSPPAFDVHSPPKSARRLSTPLRLSFTTKQRSSSASCTSTPIHLDQLDTPSTSATRSSTPLQRTRFVNPFSKHSRSRTLSPPSTSKASDASSNPSGMLSPSSPPARRRALVNKFKSILKSIPPEPSPIIHSKPILTAFNTRLRRKPVARTEPYGPPWNAPMPVPDPTFSQHSLQKPAQTMSPSPQSSRKRSVHECRFEKTSMSPGQLSPRTFINELDEKLSLLQQQRIQDSIPSPHG